MKYLMTLLSLTVILGTTHTGCRAAPTLPEQPVATSLSPPPGDLFRAYQFDFSGADPQPQF